MEIKKISPSRLVKLAFPESYKDIPEWILEKAAEFGKEMHGAIELYINETLSADEIKHELAAENKIKLFEAFIKWYKAKNFKNVKTEVHVESQYLHGYIDLLDLENNKFYDFKFRNIDNKLDIAKDVFQMVCYHFMSGYRYWELVYFDKKSAKIWTVKQGDLTNKQVIAIWELLDAALELYKKQEAAKEFDFSKKVLKQESEQ